MRKIDKVALKWLKYLARATMLIGTVVNMMGLFVDIANGVNDFPTIMIWLVMSYCSLALYSGFQMRSSV